MYFCPTDMSLLFTHVSPNTHKACMFAHSSEASCVLQMFGVHHPFMHWCCCRMRMRSVVNKNAFFTLITCKSTSQHHELSKGTMWSFLSLLRLLPHKGQWTVRNSPNYLWISYWWNPLLSKTFTLRFLLVRVDQIVGKGPKAEGESAEDQSMMGRLVKVEKQVGKFLTLVGLLM